MMNHFHLKKHKTDNSSILITIFISHNLTNSAENIQEKILQIIHQISEWYDVEIASHGPKHIFHSQEFCEEKNCTRKFVMQYKTKFYLMVIDSNVSMLNILNVLKKLESFNPLAFCLVYLHNEDLWNYEKIVKNTLNVLYSNFFAYSAVLLSINETVSNLYQLDYQTEGPAICTSNRTLYIIDKCLNGEYQSSK